MSGNYPWYIRWFTNYADVRERDPVTGRYAGGGSWGAEHAYNLAASTIGTPEYEQSERRLRARYPSANKSSKFLIPGRQSNNVSMKRRRSSSTSPYKSPNLAKRRRQRMSTPRSRTNVVKKPGLAATPALQFGRPVKGECKCVDGPSTTDPNYDAFSGNAIQTVSSTAMNWNLINGIIPGTGLHNRIGNKIQLKSLRIRGCLNPHFGATSDNTKTAPCHIRFLILYDRQPGGAFPVLGDVLETVDYNGAGRNKPMSFPKIINSTRFYTLYDRVWFIPSQCSFLDVAAATENQNEGIQRWLLAGNKVDFSIDWYKKLKGLETKYTSATANPMTSANIQSGAIYVGSISDQDMTVATAGQWDFDFTWRLRFFDA